MSHEEKYEKALEQRIEKVISKKSPVCDYLHKVKEGGKEVIQKVMFYSFVGLLSLISYSNNLSGEVKKPRDERVNFSEQEKEVLGKYSMWYSLVTENEEDQSGDKLCKGCKDCKCCHSCKSCAVTYGAREA